MKIKKTIAAVAAATLAFSLAACNRDTATDAASGSGTSITLSISTLNNPFFIQLRNGAEEAAKEAGVKLDVLDAQDDASVQQNQIADAANGQTSALLINPVDSEAAGPAVKPIIDKKLPLIAVDRVVDGATVTTNVSSDNEGGGRIAADALAEAIGKKGKVIVLQGVPGTSASRDRGAGFTEAIKKYADIEVVASQTANFNRAEGLDVATNLLQSHPDVVGIFAENDEMALGAIQALGNRAGKEVFVVGFDGTDEGAAAVKAGTMFATIAQQPGELGRQAVKVAIRAINGETVEKDLPVKVVVVDSKNISEFAK
ncbi:substrate-binding domain-containing protein [Corynebacterium caspium]|uniref:substrate-binding domain-containing protein n=1 Tax=Corynebacterium caspium TaxID=234828 RepID=UPI00035E39B7|nr:substrate-binding domain-containing protein [Corynebacterium caspium]WKD58949.1 D-ribose-binding periplasmic protein precursor [Corynebacterium caspium DSM 44850]